MTLRDFEIQQLDLQKSRDKWFLKGTMMEGKIRAIIANVQAAATAGVQLDHVDLVSQLTEILGDDDGEKRS